MKSGWTPFAFLRRHVELVSVLATAQDKLDSRRYPGPLSERREKYVLPELSAVFEDLNQWTTTWTVEAPELFETEVDHLGGPATGLRNPQQYVYLYIMVNLLMSRYSLSKPSQWQDAY